MGYRTDGTLAAVVLVAIGLAIAVRDASPSLPWLALGGIGTVVLEAAMASRASAVRRCWERDGVALGSLAVALAVVLVGSVVAPTPVLSVGLGATATYLLLLALVVVGVVPPVSEWLE